MGGPVVINIILAFGEPSFARGIRSSIQRWSGIRSFTEVNNKENLLPLLKNAPAQLLLLDDRLPGIQSPACIKNFLTDFPDIHTVIFYSNLGNLHLQQLLALQIEGYISRTSSCEKIKSALSQIISGQSYCDPDLISLHQPQPYVINSTINQIANLHLLPRELDVLHLLTHFHTAEYICNTLNIKRHTYRTYRKQINRKLQSAGYKNISEFIRGYKS